MKVAVDPADSRLNVRRNVWGSTTSYRIVTDLSREVLRHHPHTRRPSSPAVTLDLSAPTSLHIADVDMTVRPAQSTLNEVDALVQQILEGSRPAVRTLKTFCATQSPIVAVLATAALLPSRQLSDTARTRLATILQSTLQLAPPPSSATAISCGIVASKALLPALAGSAVSRAARSAATDSFSSVVKYIGYDAALCCLARPAADGSVALRAAAAAGYAVCASVFGAGRVCEYFAACVAGTARRGGRVDDGDNRWSLWTEGGGAAVGVGVGVADGETSGGVAAVPVCVAPTTGAPPSVQETHLKAVVSIVSPLGHSVLPHLKIVVGVMRLGLKSRGAAVKAAAAAAVAASATAAQPYGGVLFEGLLPLLWDGARQGSGLGAVSHLEAVAAVVGTLQEESATAHSAQLVQLALRHFRSPHRKARRSVLRCLQSMLLVGVMDEETSRDTLIPALLSPDALREDALTDPALDRLVAAVAVGLGSLSEECASLVHSMVVEAMHTDPLHASKLECCAVIVRGVTSTSALLTLSERAFERCISALLIAVRECASQKVELTGHGAEAVGDGGEGVGLGVGGSARRNAFALIERLTLERVQRVVDAAASVFAAADVMFGQVASSVLLTIRGLLRSSDPVVRASAGKLCAAAAPPLAAVDAASIRSLPQPLCERLTDSESACVVVGAVHALASLVMCLEDLEPSAADIFAYLTPMLRHPSSDVLLAVVSLMATLAEVRGGSLDPAELVRSGMDCVPLLSAPRKAVRRAAARAFSAAAQVIGPAHVVNALLSSLGTEKSTVREAAAHALALCGASCGAFVVIPPLLHEFQRHSSGVQGGVLKAVATLSRLTQSAFAPYVDAVVPMLTWALTQHDVVVRADACFAVASLATATRTSPHVVTLVHLFNLVWPNIFEGWRLLEGALAALRAITAAVGPSLVASYCVHGVVHPAASVRAAYINVLNAVYVDTEVRGT